MGIFVWKKKVWCLGAALGMAGVLAGCGAPGAGGTEKQTQNTAGETAWGTEGKQEAVPTQGGEAGKTVLEDTPYFSVNTNYETIVETEKGCYFIREGADAGDKFLYYYDKQSGMTVKLCARPDCMHEDEDCNAYLAGVKNFKTLCADGEYLYYVFSEEEYSQEAKELIRRYQNGETKDSLGAEGVEYYIHDYIGCVKTDGTVRDTVMRIESTLNEYRFVEEEEAGSETFTERSSTLSNIIAYQGNLYYIKQTAEAVELEKLDLSERTEETVASWEVPDGMVGAVMQRSWQDIWFQIEWAEAGQYAADLYHFDLDTQTVEAVLENVHDARGIGMTADRDVMYYSNEEGMWSVSAKKKEKTVITAFADADKTYYSPIPWEDHLIVGRMDCIQIYGKDGTLEQTIAFTEGDVSDGGQVMQPYIGVYGVDAEGTLFLKYDDCDLFSEDAATLHGGTVYTLDLKEAQNGNVVFHLLF